MLKKALKISVLLLCLCILLIAVPSTFAKDGDAPTKLESRFFFVTPAALLNGPVWSVLPSLLDHTAIAILLDKDSTPGGEIKACGDLTKGRPSEDG